MLVDKPAGISSHDVVSVARRAFGEKRIGHAGTLDPFATGLLVLLVGRATRLLQHLPHEPKRYVATVRFGTETDTEDLSGTVTLEAALPAADALEHARAELIGDILQVPPAYSAKRIDGTRAYKLARTGNAPAMAPSPVHVDSIALDQFELAGDVVARCRMLVTCGGGTYVRSLARDLARGAGSAAHLDSLRRTDSGPFSVNDAGSLDDLRNGRATLRPAADALPGYPRQWLAAEDVVRVSRGIDVAATVDGAFAALVALGEDGTETLVCFAERRGSEVGDRWQPRVVMRGDA